MDKNFEKDRESDRIKRTKIGGTADEKEKIYGAGKNELVLEMIRGEAEVNEIASREGIAPNQLRNRKIEFPENATMVFDKKRDQRLKDELAQQQQDADRLAKKVGQLTLEVDFLKDALRRK